MANLGVYCLVAVLLCQTVLVFSRQVDLNEFDQSFGNNNNNINNPATPPPVGSPTTTASPEFRSCFNNCPITPQYNPVCGTNQVSYTNINRLNCAKRCGLNVDLLHGGTCGVSIGGNGSV